MSGHFGFERRAGIRSTYGNSTLTKVQKVEAIAPHSDKPVLRVKSNG